MKIIPDFFLEIQKYMEIPHQLVTCHPQGLAAGSSPRVRIRLRFTWRCELLSLSCWVEKNEWGLPVLGIKQKIPLQAPSKMVFVFPWPEWMLRGYFRGLRTLLTAKHAESFVKDVKAGSFWVPSSSIRRSKSRKMLDHKRFWTVISGMVKKILYFVWSPPWHFIHFLTGKSSGILSDISSGILSGKSSGILSGISFGILSDISSGILSGISSGILSDISSGILSGILSGIPSGILSGSLSGISSGISSGILSGISSGILSGISHGILSGISSGILSDMLSGISSGILSGCWGPAVHTELGRSPVEVQRCTLSWAARRLRSSGAHWAGQLAGWGPAVHTELGSSQVEVQRCTLSWAARRLRSSGAHWAGQLAGWRPAVRTELGSWRRAWRRVGKVGKAEVEVEEAEARRRARRTASRRGGGGGGGGGHALW